MNIEQGGFRKQEQEQKRGARGGAGAWGEGVVVVGAGARVKGRAAAWGGVRGKAGMRGRARCVWALLVLALCVPLMACAQMTPAEKQYRAAEKERRAAEKARQAAEADCRKGRDLDRKIRAEVKVLEDRVVNDYIDRLGKRLLQQVNEPHLCGYTFAVIEDDELNAFVIPGGYVYLNTGAILRMRNVSELAGILGHEIGHIENGHVAEKMKRARTAGLLHGIAVLGTAVITKDSEATNIASDVAGMFAVAHINKFGRKAEAESDAFAVDLLPRARYHPDGVADLFEAMLNRNSNRRSTFLDSHPTPPERIQATRALIAQKTLPSGLHRDDRGGLEIIQHRICCLTGNRDIGPCAGIRYGECANIRRVP